jgi:hypothetical protein
MRAMPAGLAVRSGRDRGSSCRGAGWLAAGPPEKGSRRCPLPVRHSPVHEQESRQIEVRRRGFSASSIYDCALYHKFGRVMKRTSSPTHLTVRTVADTDRLMEQVRASAIRVHTWASAQSGDPLDMLRRMKFEPIGVHPIEDRRINLVEQINQTWTFAVAIAAARQLLLLHPEAGGFHLAPGAHASLALDIMSEKAGLVGAETFAAVTPRNNGKLATDLAKLAARPEVHRYVFFMCPLFPGNNRLPQFEGHGVQVWSVDV